jgi:3-dehydroquinate dehydratase-1
MVEPAAASPSRWGRRPRPKTVGVIKSAAELDLAVRMGNPPDLFELRLDRLVRPPSRGSAVADTVDRLDNKISKLRAPLIITARHPMEGGANRLSSGQRYSLLARFLSRARFVDVELRSAPAFESLLRLSRKQNVRRIISVHHLKSTPSPGQLRDKARAAKKCGADIFKVATRTDTPAQLTRLIDFVAAGNLDVAVSAMGIGKLGAASRVLLACCGSALVYVSLGRSDIEGQISLEQFRALLGPC